MGKLPQIWVPKRAIPFAEPNDYFLLPYLPFCLRLFRTCNLVFLPRPPQEGVIVQHLSILLVSKCISRLLASVTLNIIHEKWRE